MLHTLKDGEVVTVVEMAGTAVRAITGKGEEGWLG